MTRNTSRLSGAIANTSNGRATNLLAPTVAVVSEQPSASRAARRHTRTENGAVINIPKGKQAPALNIPFRTPLPAS